MRYFGSRRGRRIKPSGRFVSARDLVFFAVALSFIIGIVAGAIRANNMPFDSLSQNLDSYIEALPDINYNKVQIFAECLVKYGKSVFIIWFLTFIPTTGLVSLLIIFTKGMSISFATSVLARRFGMTGLFFSNILYLPQSLALLPAYFFIAYVSLNTALESLAGYSENKNPLGRTGTAPALFGADVNTALKNGVPFLIGMAAVLFASIIETFIVPWLTVIIMT